MSAVAVSHGTWSRVGRTVGDRPYGVGAANSTPLTGGANGHLGGARLDGECGELLGGAVVADEFVVFGRPHRKADG
jgi:hypothetical protein